MQLCSVEIVNQIYWLRLYLRSVVYVYLHLCNVVRPDKQIWCCCIYAHEYTTHTFRVYPMYTYTYTFKYIYILYFFIHIYLKYIYIYICKWRRWREGKRERDIHPFYKQAQDDICNNICILMHCAYIHIYIYIYYILFTHVHTHLETI